MKRSGFPHLTIVILILVVLGILGLILGVPFVIALFRPMP